MKLGPLIVRSGVGIGIAKIGSPLSVIAGIGRLVADMVTIITQADDIIIVG